MNDRRVSRARCVAACAVTLSALVACRSAELVGTQTVVSFSLDAPLCSSAIPAQFFIDGRQVGVDTFRIHLAPDHTVSSLFPVSPGTHIVGARVVLNGVAYNWPDVPDTTVTLHSGAAFVRALPFYCS